MARVIKEVTKELQDENDRAMGKKAAEQPREESPNRDRQCLPWKRGDKHAEMLKKAMADGDDDDDEDRPSKKKDMYELAKKWKAAKNNKDSGKKT